MAEMSGAEQLAIWRGLMRFFSRERAEIDLSKNDLLAAVTATDAWIDQNAANYNGALPAAAQAGLTQAQKTILFCAVAMARVGLDFVRRLWEVD